MLEVAARLVLGGVLAGASIAKLASPASSRAAMATFGIAGPRAQAVAWALLIVTELGLAVGVIVGSATAAVLAATLLALFAATMVGAILRGRAGAPCACFGARSTVGWPAVARNAILAVGFAALPLLPEGELSTDEWLALGLGLALLACAGLAVAVLALAREVGMLRLRLGPEAALEIPEEGPPLGSRSVAISQFEPTPEARLALAVFTSEGCHVCRALEPTIATLANEPSIAVRTFEEAAEPEVWTELGIPGSPFAVALDLDGLVLAKGTFNNLAQLESVLAAAERRRAERDLAVTAIAAGGVVARAVKPGEADAFHFCGHIFTTGSCPHPTGMPRIDGRGYPLRAAGGEPVDNTGRRVNRRGEPVNERGEVLHDPDGRPLPPAPRTRVCDETSRRYGFPTTVDGGWYRCCGGHVRKLVDCCAHHDKRINGDEALEGYCYRGRKVFCVMYFQTKVPC